MSNQMKTKVLVIDDDELLLYSLQAIIDKESDMEVVGIEQHANQALRALERVQPDIVLLDIEMPEQNGLEVLTGMKTFHPELPVILLTTFDEERYIIQGLAQGANGYLLKTPDFSSLAQNIRDVLNHRFVMPINIAVKLSKYLQASQKKPENALPQSFFEAYPLTKTEQKIIRLLTAHVTNQIIADHLSLSMKTVKNNLTTIYHKLDVQNRTEAIALINRYQRQAES